MNFFEKELRYMFEKNELFADAKFFGNCMLAKLGDDLRIKVQFEDGVVANHYNGIKAEIINRTDGVVDREVLNFGDIIGLRNGYCGGKAEPYVWRYNNDIDWYYPVSTAEKQKIASAVAQYAEMYSSQDMVQTM